MIKNIKKVLMVFSCFIFLFLIIGSISATDVNSTDVALNESDSFTDDLVDVEDNFSVNVNESEKNIGIRDTTDDSTNDKSNKNELNNSPTSVKTIQPTNMDYSFLKYEYTSGNIIYHVKPYNVITNNGLKYKEPLYGADVKLVVYTGSKYSTYHADVGNDGEASFSIKNLGIGKHKVEIHVNNKKLVKDYINVVKSSTTVYAPSTTMKLKKNSNFRIKVVDSHKNPAKKVKLSVKVYTGKKSKTYYITTNAEGNAYLKTKSLSLGTHNVVIKTSDKKYNINKNSKIIIKRAVASKKLNLNVSAPAKNVEYNKGTYFTMTVKDNYDDAVKNVNLAVKVFTGKSSKNYKVKTNANGVAKLNTKSFSLGTHKVTIKSLDKKYNVDKTSKIVVKKVIASTKITPTNLKTLQYYSKIDSNYIKLTWDSKNGSTYQIVRKSVGGDFKVFATVKATSSSMSYSKKVDDNNFYTYAVREIVTKGSDKIIKPYDREGLKLLGCPDVNVDFQNLKAIIQWTKVKDASKYLIFRKVGRDGQFKCIATVDAKHFNYTDVYYKSDSELKGILNGGTFADPSYNSLFYTVRACNIASYNGADKISYGLYLKDGDFHLESPSIVSLENNVLKWGSVPNAEGYLILKKSDGDWKVIKNVNATGNSVKSTTLKNVDNNAFYSVKAYADKNGKTVYSSFDEGFTLKNYSTNNSENRILYFGDSITYGSPYKAASTRHIFSIPNRVSQLLGCVYYNPSIPGSTYHDLGQVDGKNVLNSGYYRYRICREVVDAMSVGELPGNWKDLDNAKNSEGKTNTNIEDYNIVVLAAGTNDYIDNAELGDENSNDTFYFNGAFNHVMGKIEQASQNRVDRGESPIKVVFVDLYYSDRTYGFKKLNNRDVTPNNIGLTLMDYQNAIDKQYEKWSGSEYLSLYNFKTRSYNIVNQENCPYTASDNLHFTKYTYGQYGNAFADFLTENVF